MTVKTTNDKYQCVSGSAGPDKEIIASVLYPLFSFLFLYVGPLIVISMSYAVILYVASTKTGQT
uniref:Uncharacterized protein n=1 Tax=Romanomermis culicivorax TaxID=13658 RepID=A0A915IJK1_ROMCU